MRRIFFIVAHVALLIVARASGAGDVPYWGYLIACGVCGLLVGAARWEARS